MTTAPTNIDLGIYILRGDVLEPFEPRTNTETWIERRSRRERRHLARRGTRGRRAAGRIQASVPREADQFPLQWEVRVEVKPTPPPHPGDRRQDETLYEYIMRLQSYSDACEEFRLRPPLPSWEKRYEPRVLRCEHFCSEVVFGIHCACSERCVYVKQHVVRIGATVYTDDSDRAWRLVDQLAKPRIRELAESMEGIDVA